MELKFCQAPTHQSPIINQWYLTSEITLSISKCWRNCRCPPSRSRCRSGTSSSSPHGWKCSNSPSGKLVPSGTGSQPPSQYSCRWRPEYLSHSAKLSCRCIKWETYWPALLSSDSPTLGSPLVLLLKRKAIGSFLLTRILLFIGKKFNRKIASWYPTVLLNHQSLLRGQKGRICK